MKRRAIILLILLVVVGATIAAYANTFGVPFLLDDRSAITANPSICHLTAWARVLWPPETATTAGRPLLNLSFACNYGFGGVQPASYHLVNLAIHLAAGLALFGIVRRTLARAAGQGGVARGVPATPGFDLQPMFVAAAVAAIWLLDPLETEAVTYISQRAESLMALWALVALYCFVRATDATDAAAATAATCGTAAGRTWYVGSIAACAGGMATKEVMVTIPAVVLLYDRAFVSGSLRAALERRRGYYAGLALTWVLLAMMMVSAHVLAHPSVGFHTPTPLGSYWAAETKALVQYAKLAAWPHPLVFDYGSDVSLRWPAAVPFVLAIGGAAVAAARLWRSCKSAAFLLTTYLLLLAPTSLVPVAFDPMAESRAYLPSAALVALAVGAACTLGGRRALPALAAIALTFAALTWHRNREYGSAAGLWARTVAECPGSSRAHYSLGYELARDPARRAAALAELAAALRIRPAYPEALSRSADLLAGMRGREAEAIAAYQDALRVQPDYVVARNNLANLLARLPGRAADAEAQYGAALRFDPDYRPAHYNLANLLARTPARWPEAIAHYRRAIALDPDYALARNNLGLLYAAEGRTAEAMSEWRQAIAADPACAVARQNLRRWGSAGN